MAWWPVERWEALRLALGARGCLAARGGYVNSASKARVNALMALRRVRGTSSVQRPFPVRAIQRKRRHVDLETLTAFGHHLVAPGHDAGRGRQRHAGGVFEALARREHRLLADHALAADFLLVSGGVGDDPVPRL